MLYLVYHLPLKIKSGLKIFLFDLKIIGLTVMKIIKGQGL